MFMFLAILTGWVIVEIKEFFKNDGTNNNLAFILLKIIFILFTMTCSLLVHIAPNAYSRLMDLINNMEIYSSITPHEKVTEESKFMNRFINNFKTNPNKANN